MSRVPDPLRAFRRLRDDEPVPALDPDIESALDALGEKVRERDAAPLPEPTTQAAPAEQERVSHPYVEEALRQERERLANRTPEQVTNDNVVASMERGQTSGDPLSRAISVARSRGDGNAQLVLNPFVQSNREHFESIAEQRDAVQQLLGQTHDPEQQREIQRVLSVTEDRLSGRTTSPDDLFAETSAEAENIARWATRNNVSRGRVTQAMRQMQARAAARTGISKTMEDKARKAQAQAQQLEAFKQSMPHLAPFATIDQETGQPTVNKEAANAEIQFQELRSKQAQKQAEIRAQMLKTAREAQAEQDKMLLEAFGLQGGPPDPGEIRLANDQMMKAAKATGTDVDPAQFKNLPAERAAYQEKWEQYQLARSINGREIFRDILSREELDERFPVTGATPSFLASLSPAAKAIVGQYEAVAKKPEPLPPGKTGRQVSEERDIQYIPSRDPEKFNAILNRMFSSGVVGVGDTIATDHGIITVSTSGTQ